MYVGVQISLECEQSVCKGKVCVEVKILLVEHALCLAKGLVGHPGFSCSFRGMLCIIRKTLTFQFSPGLVNPGMGPGA